MGEKGVRMAGGAEGEVGSVCHCVVLNMLWEETTFLQEDPKNMREKREGQVSAMLQSDAPPRITNNKIKIF